MLQYACLYHSPNLAFASQCTIRSLYTPASTSHGTRIRANFNALESPTAEQANEDTRAAEANSPPAIDKDIKKVVQKTAATFAPRPSTAQKNPAVPGTVLYTVFEVQGYLSMMLGGALAFNLVLPSSEPDIWRLMGMWSIWMFSTLSMTPYLCLAATYEIMY